MALEDWIPSPPLEDPTLPVNDSLNDTANATEGMLSEQPPFIHSGYAYVISGVFVWSALFLTCFQVSWARRGSEGGKNVCLQAFAFKLLTVKELNQ